jgi:hypothetical protein
MRQRNESTKVLTIFFPVSISTPIKLFKSAAAETDTGVRALLDDGANAEALPIARRDTIAVFMVDLINYNIYL